MRPSAADRREGPGVGGWVLLVLLGVLTLGFLLAPWPAGASREGSWTLLTRLEALSFGIDPQRPAHSHFLGGTRLPLEARKMGIYGGFAVVLGYLLALGRRRAARLPSVPILATLIGFLALMAADGTNNFLHDVGLPHLYPPDNRLRLATGLLTGVMISAVLWPIFNHAFWRHPAATPSLQGWWELPGALAVCVPIYLAGVLGAGFALYPLAVLGAMGLLALVGLLNAVIVLVVTGREGQGESVWDLVLPLTAGVLLAVAELGGLAVLRYVILGFAI